MDLCGWLEATSQKLVGSQVLILNRNKVDYIKYIVNTYKWLKQINMVEALSSLTWLGLNTHDNIIFNKHMQN